MKEIPPRYRHPRGDSSKPAVLFLFIFLVLAVWPFASVSRGAQLDRSFAKVTGIVFVEDSAGARSAVAGAKVTLSGPAIIETKTDEDGNFSVSSVPSGTYQVKAVALGLAIRQPYVSKQPKSDYFFISSQPKSLRRSL